MTGSQSFPHLFSPLTLGSLVLKNRIVCLPHGNAFGEDSLPTRRNIFYLRERAKGGAGLVIAEGSPVHVTAVNHHRKFAIYEERSVPMLRELTAAVHAEGCPILQQILHSGRAHSSFHQRVPIWAPSPIADPRILEIPHEMDADDIAELVEAFAQSAERAMRVGFDGIEIHAANGTLPQQFLSPWSNKRTDEYGGSIENRQRIVLEIVDAVRRAAGPKAVVGVRICGDELIPEGYDDAQMKVFVPALERTGQIDYISVTAGVRGAYVGDATVPQGAAVSLAEQVKKLVTVPVVTAMRIKTPRMAEDILANGQADLIGMARALIADPELPNKAREGRGDEIRYCTGGLQGCRRAQVRVGRISCTTNAAVGEEETLGIGTIARVERPRRVVVVGGGPAGMEAARVAALRGHQVTLLERETELGGQIRIITRIPALSEYGEVTSFLTYQIQKLGVETRLGIAATPDGVLALNPDAVIVATGSTPVLPTLQGLDPAKAFTATDALIREIPGPNVVVVEETGGWESCGTAEYLAKCGWHVTIVSRLKSIGQSLPFDSASGIYDRLASFGIAIRPYSALVSMNGSTLRCRDRYSEAEFDLEGVSAVVFASPNRSEDGVYRMLRGRVASLFRVGDAMAPRHVDEAVREGHLAAREV